VNAPFSRKKQLRFHYLIAKRDLHTLTEEEYHELLSLTQAFEKYELRRLKLLTKLADIKKITLPEVIDYITSNKTKENPPPDAPVSYTDVAPPSFPFAPNRVLAPL